MISTFKTRILSATLAVAAARFAVGPAGAQPPTGNPYPPAAPANYQAHAVRYMRADELRPHLQQLLAGRNEPADIHIDVAGNRLLVQGSPVAQAVVAQAIAAFDRPAPAPTPVASQPFPQAAAPTSSPAVAVAQSPPTVRSYAVPADALAPLAAELQNAYGPGGARVAVDARSGQLLVVAGDDVQRAVADRIALGAPRQTAPAAADPSSTVRLPLVHVDWATFENQLRTIYGSRLSPATMGDDGWRRLRLATVEGTPLDIAFLASNREVAMQGPAGTVVAAQRLLKALDRGAGEAPERIVPYRPSGEQALRQALAVSHRITPAAPQAAPLPAAPRGNPILINNLFQPQDQVAQAQAAQAQPPAQPPVAQQPVLQQPIVQPPVVVQPVIIPPAAGAAPPVAGAPGAEPPGGGLVGPVQIEFLDGLDVLIISGNDRDVERVMKIIEDIERLSVDTQPTIDVLPLQHVASDVMAGVVTQIYDSVLSVRQGRVTITALVKPNALLLIGRAESVAAVRELVAKLDQPVDASTQFAVFPLKHATAAAVQPTLQAFFADRPALGGKVQVTADVRSNALIIRAGPRDLTEAGELIKRLDVSTGEAESELRVFTLQHSLAIELAPVLQDAIAAQAGSASTAQLPPSTISIGTQPLQPSTPVPSGRSTALKFSTIDAQGHRQLKSGILTEVRITADPRANALLVAAPSEAMELIGALINQLDGAPTAESQIKVFTIVNGDAGSLVEMLQALFGIRTTGGGAGGGVFGAQQQPTQGQNPLIQLRFSVDQRTNSIIATGGADDLNVVEAILLRLDESDVRQRQSIVYRLKNAPANDVANAINQFLRSERDVQQANTALLSPFEQIEKEVVVVPEPVSNSLIVSATPRYFEEVRKLVEEIDARPPMVLIQVLIAEVALNNTDEFGAEIGLQDSVLFDRSLLGDLVTITNSTQQAVPGGGTITTQNQNVVAATNSPGFAFNNAPIGNSGSNNALAKANVLGSQGISSFAVGRTNADLGFGGLVLSASSESVSVLIRALQESRRLDVLSRPQVMTLDNQAAFVQVGARVPRVQGVTINATGQVNNVVDVNVGLILGVTPRISPDGLVVMEIDAEKSALGPEAEGVPISIAANGDVVRQPVINTTTAQTTISAMNGQTVVLGGLITKTRAQTHRRVPILSSIPILGNLFRYDLEASERTELLIIMTPHVVRNDDDVTRLRQIETSRMSWVLGDVKKLHGTAGFGGYDVLADEETLVIYPDQTPGAEQIPVGKPAGTVPPQPMQTEQQDAVDLSTPRNTASPNLRIPGTAPPNPTPSNPPPPPRLSIPGTLPQPDDDAGTNPLRGVVPIGAELSDDELLPTTVSYGAPPTPRGASIIPVTPPANANRGPAPESNDSSSVVPGYAPQGYGRPNFVPQAAAPQAAAPQAYMQPAYGQPAYGSPSYPAAGQVVPVGYVAPVQNGVSYGSPYGTSSGTPVVPASTGVGP